MTSHSRTDSLDRTACRLVFTYGGDAAMVAYTKAVYCESQERVKEARRWRSVLGRVVAIDNALHPVPPVASVNRSNVH